MITIQQLPNAFKIPVPPGTPKCCASITNEVASRGRNRQHGTRCCVAAKLRINGKLYCLRHAQQVALRMLMDGVQPAGARKDEELSVPELLDRVAALNALLQAKVLGDQRASAVKGFYANFGRKL